MENIDLEEIKATMESLLTKNKDHGFEIGSMMCGLKFDKSKENDCNHALFESFLERATTADIHEVMSYFKMLNILNIPTAIGPFIENVYSALNAMMTLTDVASPIISVAIRLGLKFLSKSSPENVATVVKGSLERALKISPDSEIQAAAEDTIKKFRLSQAFLCTQCDQIYEQEAAALPANVSIFEGVEIIGTLQKIIHTNSSSKTAEGVNCAMQYLELYSILQSYRFYLLIQMYTLVKSAPKSEWTARAIYNVIAEEMKMNKNFLEFIHAPSYDQRLFCVKFNLSEWPNTKKYLDCTKTPYQNHEHLLSGKYTMNTTKWENYRMTMTNSVFGWCESEKSLEPPDRSQFQFELVSLENSTYRIKSFKWPSCYVVMSYCFSFCKCSNEKDDLGEWKIIQFNDKNYMLCLANWPDLFMHMISTPGGSVNGKKNPGRAGRWKIRKICLPT